jgi:hypothetical protein
MLELIFSIYLALTIILCFVRIKIGIALFLFYSILVPFLKFFSLGQNLFTFSILIALIVNYNYKSFVYKPLKPFLFLYLAQFLIIPFHYDVPYLYQLNLLRADFMSTFLLPFTMVNVMDKDPKALALFSKTLLTTIVIVIVYTLFLTQLHGINPYMMMILPLSGKEFNEAYALADNGGRMFGRISSVFPHPMTNGLFLSLSSLFIFSKIDANHLWKDKLKIVLFFIIIITIVVIGVRTAIGAVLVGFSLLLLYERKFKLVLMGIIIVFIVFIFIQQIPGTEDYIRSIINPQSSAVKGSSTEMRLTQLQGGLDAISNNYLFGKGYGWTEYYKSLHDSHPTMLAFESLILVVLCNNGFIGVIIWIIMLLLYAKLLRKFSHSHMAIMLALMAIYFAYSLITGEYGYLKYFLIFYTIIGARSTTNPLSK